MANPYLTLLGAQVRAQTQYRTSFVIDTLAGGLITAVDAFAVLVIFRVTPALGAFSVAEVLAMTGLSHVAFALAEVAVGNIDTMRHYIRTGRFDAVLIRPLRILPQLAFGDFSLRRLGRVAEGGVVLTVALVACHVDWTPARVAMLVVAPLAGAVIFASMFVAGSSVAFWFVESGEFANAFTYGGNVFALYPITVYPGWFRAIFAYGLGFAFVAYYPALALLGRPDPLGLPGYLAWCAPLVSVLAVVAAGLIWRTGVRHYRSTGS